MVEDEIQKIGHIEALIADYARKNPEEERSFGFNLKGFFVAAKLKLQAKCQAFERSNYHKKLAEIINQKILSHSNIFDREITGKVLRWFHDDTLKHLDTKNQKIRHVIQEAIFHSQDENKQAALAKMLEHNLSKKV